MNENNVNKRLCRVLLIGFICFILNIIIIMSASKVQFDVLELGDRWDFHHFMMKIAIWVIIAILILSWMLSISVASNNENIDGFTILLCSLSWFGLLILFILIYVEMGQMWHNDPAHTILFYKEFWYEGITDNLVYNQTEHNRLECHPSLRGFKSIPTCMKSILMGDVELAPKWVYVMSDVVMRIYGFSLMFILFICYTYYMLCLFSSMFK
jgi:hypothetical protein